VVLHWIQGFLLAGFHRMIGSCSSGFGFKYGFLKIWILGFQDVWISGFQDVWISLVFQRLLDGWSFGFFGFRTFGCLDFRIFWFF